MDKVIKIRGLDCAACAAELSEELEAIEGVTHAAADFINQRVSLSYETAVAFETAVDVISHFEEVEIIDGNAPEKKESHFKEILSIAISAAFFAAGLIFTLIFDSDLLGLDRPLLRVLCRGGLGSRMERGKERRPCLPRRIPPVRSSR